MKINKGTHSDSLFSLLLIYVYVLDELINSFQMFFRVYLIQQFIYFLLRVHFVITSLLVNLTTG